MLNPIVTISPQVFAEFRNVLNIISKNSDEIIIENGKIIQNLTLGDTVLYADLTKMLGSPIDFTINKLKDVVKKPLKAMVGHNNVVFFDDTENEQYIITNKTVQIITNKLVSKTNSATIPSLSNIDANSIVDSVKLKTDLDAVRDICSGEENIKLMSHDNSLFGINCGNIKFIFEQYTDRYDVSDLPKTNTDGSPLLTFTTQSFLCMKPELGIEIKVVRTEKTYWLITNYTGACSYMTYENLVVSNDDEDSKEFEV